MGLVGPERSIFEGCTFKEDSGGGVVKAATFTEVLCIQSQNVM
jgi:hypothetical protein